MAACGGAEMDWVVGVGVAVVGVVAVAGVRGSVVVTASGLALVGVMAAWVVAWQVAVRETGGWAWEEGRARPWLGVVAGCARSLPTC